MQKGAVDLLICVLDILRSSRAFEAAEALSVIRWGTCSSEPEMGRCWRTSVSTSCHRPPVLVLQESTAHMSIE